MVIKRFFSELFRSKVTLTLNILGLTLAYTACMVIFMHVKYEITFDKGYATFDKIYQLDIRKGLVGKFEPYIARPLAELAFSSIPLIKSSAVREYSTSQFNAYRPEIGASSSISVQSYKASAHLPEVFGFEAICGNVDDFYIPQKAIIPQNIAYKIFGDEDPVGKALILHDEDGANSVEIIAVYKDMPTNSSLPNAIIVSLADEDFSVWGNVSYCGYMLINSHIDAKEAETHINKVASEAIIHINNAVKEGALLPNTYDNINLQIQSLYKRYFDPDNPDHLKGNKKGLISLIAVAIIVIIMAVINFINFSLSCVPKRISTINIKKIHGCSIWRLKFDQYIETVIITMISAVLSLFLIYCLSYSFFAKILEADMALGANKLIIRIIFGIAVLTGLAASIIPANYATSIPTITVIHGAFALTKKGELFRRILIVLQYIASSILIIVALSVHKQYDYMVKYDLGFEKSAIFTTRLSAEMISQQTAITDKLKQNQGIIDVAYSDVSIVNCEWSWSLMYGSETIKTIFFPVSSNFTAMMNISIIEGRDFTIEDESGSGKYIFNETAQKEYGIRVGDLIQNHRRRMQATIVGIAKNFNFKPLHYRVEPFALYVGGRNMWELAQAYIKVQEQDIENSKHYIRTTLLEFDPDAASTFKLESIDQHIGNLYQKERNLSVMISTFSFLAVIISTIGALGMVFFELQFRRKEVGVRKVLGATIANILMIFNKKYMKIIIISFAVAIPIAYVVIYHWQQNFMYKASISIFLYFVACAVLLIITVTLISLQSLKIARQNPTQSISK